MKLELLRVEVLEEEDKEVEDEVDMAELILRMIVKSKPINNIGVTKEKGKTDEIGHELNVFSVTSMTIMQTNADHGSATIVVSLVTLLIFVKLRTIVRDTFLQKKTRKSVESC